MPSDQRDQSFVSRPWVRGEEKEEGVVEEEEEEEEEREGCLPVMTLSKEEEEKGVGVEEEEEEEVRRPRAISPAAPRHWTLISK